MVTVIAAVLTTATGAAALTVAMTDATTEEERQIGDKFGENALDCHGQAP
jgi:hypothetical protein